jgi:hypothetical protein
MIVKRVARYSWLLAILVSPVVAQTRAEQSQGPMAGIEDKVRQSISDTFDAAIEFDRKMEDFKDLQDQIATRHTVWKRQVLAQHLFKLEALRQELGPSLENLEKGVETLETQLRNQPGLAKPETIAGIRRTLETRKREIDVSANTNKGVAFLKLTDGRTLLRIGPEAPFFTCIDRKTTEVLVDCKPSYTIISQEAIERSVTPAGQTPIYYWPSSPSPALTLEIFAVAENDAPSTGQAGLRVVTQLLSIQTEMVGGSSNWKDLDIQLSSDWQRIGVYRQQKDDAWTSEFWCLAKDSYERCPGPANEAPPSPRRIHR